MSLTPSQLRNVERFRVKYGEEAAARLAERYAAEQPPVVQPSAAPAPPPSEVSPLVGAREQNLDVPQRPAPELRPAQPGRVIELAGQAQGATLAKLAERRTDYRAARAEAQAIARRAASQDRTSDGAARTTTDPRTKQGPAAVAAALAPQRLKTQAQAEEERRHNEDLMRQRREGEKLGRKAFHRAVMATRQGYTEHARKQLLMEDPTVEPDGDEVAELSRRLWNADVRILAPELVEKRERTLTDVGAKLVEDVLTKKLPGGGVAESGLAQGLRALNAPWRFVSEPLMQAVTYEVDDQGNPLDKEDFAYKAELAAREYVPEAVRTYTIPGTSLPRPFQASRRTTSAGTRAAQETSDYWQDVAVAIAAGRDMTDEFTELPNYVAEWEAAGFPNQPWVTGMAVELLLPTTPAGLLAKGASTAAGAAADVVKAVRPGTKLERVLRVGESPLAAAQRLNALRAARREMQGVEAPMSAVDAAEDAYGVHRAAADTITREMVAPQVLHRAVRNTNRATATPAELNRALGWVAESSTVKRLVASSTDANGKVHLRALRAGVESWMDGVKRLDEAGKLSDSAKLAYVIGTRASKKSTGIVASRASKYAAELRKTGMPAPLADAEGFRAAASDVLRQRFMDKAPVDAIFVTPTVIVKRSAFESGAVDDVGREVQAVMAGRSVGGVWKFDNPEAARRALAQALGPQKVRRSEYWAGYLDRLSAGEDITELDYSKGFDAVMGDRVVRKLKGEELVFDGPQAQAARRPLERRGLATDARSAVELARAIAPDKVQQAIVQAMDRPGLLNDTIRKLLPTDVLPPDALSPARSAMGLRVWVDSLDGEVANVQRRMMTELAQYRKKYGPVEGFQRMIQDYVQRTNTLYVEGGPEVSEFTAWRHVIGKFFEDAKTLSDEQFKGVLGIGSSSGRIDNIPALTPENFAKVVERMRQSPRFRSAGLRKVFGKDDIFAAFLSWMVETEVGLVVRGTFREALEKHPEFRVDVYNMLDIPADETARALGQAMSDRGIDYLARAPRADGRTLNDVLNDHMRNIAMRFSDEQRFLLGELLVAHKLSAGDLGATPASLESIKHAIGRLLDRQRLADDIKTLGFDNIDPEDMKELVDAAMEMVVNTTLRGTDVAVQDMLRLWGAVDTKGGLGQTFEHLAEVNNRFVNIAGQERLSAMLGHDLTREISEIRASVQGGAFERNLAALRISEKEGVDYVVALVKSFLAGSRRVATSGMLGGILLPNTRFHGVNILTAPAIMAMTLGVPTTLKTLGVPRLMNWFQLRLGNADAVAFQAKGKTWTNRMVQDAIDRNNFRFSQVGFEFANVAIEDMRRVAQVDTSAAKAAGPGTRAWRWVNPANKNFWSTFAEESDNAWRTNVFVTALKMGKTEAEAAQLARKSLLDYGAIPTAEREAVARYIMFWSFQRNMALETALAVARNPRTVRNIGLIHREQHERAETWAFGKSWNQTRAWMRVLKDIGVSGVRHGVAGPATPPMESAAALGNVMQAIVWGNIDALTVKEGAVDMAYNPTVQLMKELAGGTDRLPARHVALLMNAGLWTWAQEALEVQRVEDAPVDKDRRRPGEGTFRGQQYRMSEKGRQRYYTMLWVAAQLGWRRTVEDYNKGALATGSFTPEGAELPREEAPNPLLFSLGLDTEMKVPTELESMDAVTKKNMNALRDMAK